jgi:hypothetical protein
MNRMVKLSDAERRAVASGISVSGSVPVVQSPSVGMPDAQGMRVTVIEDSGHTPRKL